LGIFQKTTLSEQRNEAETAELRTIKRRLQHGYRDAV
jgi:hypothetical protein